jgi:DNA gyrase subunit A
MGISSITGLVVGVMPVAPTDELMLITNNGKLIRCKLESVRTTSRNTKGVILFKTLQDEKVVSASLIVDNSEEESGDSNVISDIEPA